MKMTVCFYDDRRLNREGNGTGENSKIEISEWVRED
jgi:hypothetical protein